MRVALFISISFGAFLLGCSRSPRPTNGVLIQTSGEFTPLGRAWVLSVQPDGHYQVSRDMGISNFDWRHFRFMHASVSWSHDWNPRPGWFLFIEDGNHLWEFDGADTLLVHVDTADGVSGVYSLDYYKGKVPDAVWRALPIEARGEIQKHQHPKL
jgi:hypothetical protein